MLGNLCGESTLSWGQKFGAGIWVNWTCKNKFLFAQQQSTLQDMLRNYSQLTEDITACFPTEKKGKGHIEKLLCWKPPQTGFLKLNVDGASKGNPGEAGARGVFRRNDGSWVVSFARRIGLTTNFGHFRMA